MDDDAVWIVDVAVNAVLRLSVGAPHLLVLVEDDLPRVVIADLNLMGIPDGGSAAGHDAWRMVRAICVELAGEGLLDPADLARYVIPIYERTEEEEEVRRPFVEGFDERLELEEMQIAPVENPAAAAYREDGDATKFARDFTAFFRAFSEPSLKAGLAASGEAIEELYKRPRSRLEAGADTFAFEVNAVTAVIARSAE